METTEKRVAHTPGPWVAKIGRVGDAEGFWNIKVADKALIHGFVYDEPEAEANARLMAAAPDLLDAAMFVVNDAKPGENARLTTAGYNRLCAAIALATT